jgi:hypothetical protein
LLTSSPSYVGSEAWMDVQQFAPDAITIMLGTEDARPYNWAGVQKAGAETFAGDFVEFVQTLQALPSKPKVE